MIAIYGAGHSAALAARRLVAQRREVLVIARSAEPLRALLDELGEASSVQLALDDRAALEEALEPAAAVINCAGPFADTAAPLAAAAAAAGCHYVDVSAEPAVIQHTLDDYGPRASAAGVALVPAAGFYCALADSLAGQRAAREPVERITVAYAIDNWLMTRASRATAMGLAGQERLVFSGGRHRAAPAELVVGEFSFPDPVGDQPVIAYAGGEVVTIPRHAEVSEVDIWMTARTFNEKTMTSVEVSAEERATSEFLVVVEAPGTPPLVVRGRDIYATGAVISTEIALALATASDPPTGGLSPAEAIETEQLLDALAKEGLLAE